MQEISQPWRHLCRRVFKMLSTVTSSWLFLLACFAVACIAVMLIKGPQTHRYQGSRAIIGYYLLASLLLD